MKNFFFLIVALLLISGCQQKVTERATSTPEHWENIPQALRAGLEAHGGLEKWASMQTLEFAFPKGETKEFQQVDLPSRKVRITHDDYTIGFDGQEVWVAPGKEAFPQMPPRFYHNLIFYFYAIPYVLADPGINYTVLPDRRINGKDLSAIKISYNEGVGDAPDDYYIAHFDKSTNELYLLLYTVTYFSGSTNENFSALVYDEWMEVNGLKLPKVMKGYRYAADTLGTERYTRIFDEVKITEEALDPSLFEIPEIAEIDPLTQPEPSHECKTLGVEHAEITHFQLRYHQKRHE